MVVGGPAGGLALPRAPHYAAWSSGTGHRPADEGLPGAGFTRSAVFTAAPGVVEA